MLTFDELWPLIGGRDVADAPCPACSPFRKPHHRKLKVLRIWKIDDHLLSYNCAHCEEAGYVRNSSDLNTVGPHNRAKRQANIIKAGADADVQRMEQARRLWRESVPASGTWAEDYLAGRGLTLPVDPEICDRTLRFHPHCPFPDKTKAPALLAAFTPVWSDVPSDPFYDPPPQAIHRIRGRGHDNKKMLGPVAGCAVIISPWWTVHGVLNICEGIETALAIMARGGVPIWAMGSAGAIERMPVVGRVKRLTIWADNDRSGQGLQAARVAAKHWSDRGTFVHICKPLTREDYADV